GVALLGSKSLLESPWLDLIAFSIPAWAALIAACGDRLRSVSVETVFLWALTFACFNVAALEVGRGEGRGAFPEVAVNGARGPKPVGKIWEQRPPADGTTYATPLPADGTLYVAAV